MNENSAGSRRHGGRRRHLAALAAALAVTALPVAACGGTRSTAPRAGSGQLTAQAVDAFARCMRGHGVSNFYPFPKGSVPTGPVLQLGPWAFTNVNFSSPTFTSAFAACRHLAALPAGPPPPLTATQIQSLVRAAACMRAHGYPGYPDPDVKDGHLVQPSLPAGIDTSSPQFQAALQTCHPGNA
jgi:hypothetical protein